ncbi:FKBP-type peptidyl-prolyl cis-trans isomerase FkpA precursor [Marinobacterium lacunae]|uniref:Peptidyl-prolyl cis-trans isomerase n=1 Tax=Marinobacterium lacunae TaxID=1232683 RepID=A0A081FZW7_9GAMM|nr:FKBP-type peptidyl-prolyl cis-trans isomerase [Marinobacterium lacunae]KEA64072.1 FKBP-type peptidyl-prolyl cis-trans isomerase FkpA precursor [Marinobacterium lacunae]MBR9882367.1 FKBP-type peptidyl-prolyl cis-trans isomerase [Oceanospirillales bacterium]
MKLLSRRSLLGIALAFGPLVLLVGCGEDPEEARFRQELVDKALNDETRRAGDAFLAENAKQPGVVVKPSGLQYKVMREGSGAKPGPKDVVVVHYEGTRIDGEVFDSSYERGKPARFPLNQVIRGWSEGLMDMRAGGERMLYLPADLAYGARSPSHLIPANSALIFKVELLDVEQEGSSEQRPASGE